MNFKAKTAIIAISVALTTSACATKNFGEINTLEKAEVSEMNCEQIENEFTKLVEFREAVNEKSKGGQVKQMLWGGMWSVMADDKREAVARDEIKQRELMLGDAKTAKGCTF